MDPPEQTTLRDQFSHTATADPIQVEQLNALVAIKFGLEKALDLSKQGNLTVLEIRILLKLLRSAGASNAKLADETLTDRSNTLRALHSLCSKELAELALIEKRSKLYRLTAQGCEKAELLEAELLRRAQPLLSRLENHHDVRSLSHLIGRRSLTDVFTGNEIDLRQAGLNDLRWLAIQAPFERAADPQVVQARARELADHIDFDAERGHAWVLTDWSRRVGGCVLNGDPDDIAKAIIALFYIESHITDAAAFTLFDECLKMAQAQTYESVKITPSVRTTKTETVLSRLGFQMVGREKVYYRNEFHELMVWERQLLAPLPGVR